MLKRYLFLFAIWVFVMFFWALPALAEMIVDTSWVRRYNGPENDNDYAYAITIDGSGNIYVTGWSFGPWTNEDYATIKYYPNGDTAWVRRYNGPGNSNDEARVIAVDGSGNVYVTGCDYATIKYHPNGDTAWVRRYSGPGDDWDQARAIAVDGSGNVYVTGWAYGSETDNDYATIKYLPNGDTAWTRRFDGPGNYYNYANDIVIDSSSNVYVTGDDYTVKYYPNGDTAWARRYNIGNP